MPLVIASVVVVLTLAIGGNAAPPAASTSPPSVTVEEGGVVTAPCSPATVAGCTVGQVSGWFQTAFCDGKDHNGTAFRVNQTHCSCRLPPSFAEAPVAVAFVDAAGRASKPLLTDYVALWHTSLGKRPYLSSDKYAELLVRVHPSIKGAFVAAKLPDGTRLLDWSPVNAGSTTRLSLPLSSLRPVSAWDSSGQPATN